MNLVASILPYAQIILSVIWFYPSCSSNLAQEQVGRSEEMTLGVSTKLAEALRISFYLSLFVEFFLLYLDCSYNYKNQARASLENF